MGRQSPDPSVVLCAVKPTSKSAPSAISPSRVGTPNRQALAQVVNAYPKGNHVGQDQRIPDALRAGPSAKKSIESSDEQKCEHEPYAQQSNA